MAAKQDAQDIAQTQSDSSSPVHGAAGITATNRKHTYTKADGLRQRKEPDAVTESHRPHIEAMKAEQADKRSHLPKDSEAGQIQPGDVEKLDALLQQPGK